MLFFGSVIGGYTFPLNTDQASARFHVAYLGV